MRGLALDHRWGRVQVRRNLAPDPQGVAGVQFGVAGGSNTRGAAVSSPDLPAGVETAARIAWTDAPTGSPASVYSSLQGSSASPVLAGESYTIQAHVFTSFLLAVGFRLDVNFYDESGAALPSSTGEITSLSVGAWRSFTREVVPPPGAAFMRMGAAFSGPQTNGAGGHVMATAFMLEEGGVVLPYFDGSTAPRPGDVTLWDGPPGASSSTLYTYPHP